MPGIFGFVNYRGKDIKKDMVKMANRMGSSDLMKTNIWYDMHGRVGLGYTGFHYLIQEEQPVSVNSEIKMLLWGEVVDEEKIRRGLKYTGLSVDNLGKVGLVLMQYLQHGIDIIPKINGSHAVAIWDELNQKLTLIPDRFGQRALYYAEVNGGLAFASEIKGLLALEFVPKSINLESVMEYLAIEQLNYDRTFLQWVNKIPFGCSLMYYRDSALIENRWPVLYRQPEKELSESEYLEEFIRLSGLAVRKRIKYPQTCIGLSGGLDSRLLTALAVKENPEIDTITYGQKGSRDLARGKKVATALNLPHRSLLLKDDYLQKYARVMIDRVDGLFNVLNCHGMILTEVAARYPVISMANGLDQFLWASGSKHSEYKESKNIPETVFKTQNEFIYQVDWKKWFTTKWYEKLSDSVYQNFINEYSRIQADTDDNHIDSFIVQTYANYFGASLPMISHKMEYTIPFYDTEFIEFVLNLPLSMRWNRKLEKLAISHISPLLAEIDGGPIAKPFLWEKIKKKISKLSQRAELKLGLISPTQLRPPSSTYNDMHQLLRKNPYRLWLEKTLLRGNVILGDIFRPEILKQLIEQHTRGELNRTKELGVILTVEMYLKNILGDSSEVYILNNLEKNISPISIENQNFVL
ncbi:MAG: hypothetical protein CL609_08670 [Anaerolineaceae bacterium]|nr:hypothetical protein [Anaerolineaceae bacterium]